MAGAKRQHHTAHHNTNNPSLVPLIPTSFALRFAHRRVNFPQYGIEVDLPKQLHASTMSLPALMLSSTEMFDIPRIRDGQETIKGQCPQVQASVLEGTKHGNFIDTVFWIPSCLSRFVNLSGKMIHPHKTYAEIIQTIATFLDEQTGPGMAEGDDSVV